MYFLLRESAITRLRHRPSSVRRHLTLRLREECPVRRRTHGRSEGCEVVGLGYLESCKRSRSRESEGKFTVPKEVCAE